VGVLLGTFPLAVLRIFDCPVAARAMRAAFQGRLFFANQVALVDAAITTAVIVCRLHNQLFLADLLRLIGFGVVCAPARVVPFLNDPVTTVAFIDVGEQYVGHLGAA